MNNVDTYELSDKSSCKIAPGWRCNLFSWTAGGTELMFCPEGYPGAAAKITGGGNPILFPSVGRTWDRSSGKPAPGVYRIFGSEKTYFMPSHGILFLSRFEKIDESISEDSVTALYELIVPDKVRGENYPFDVGLMQRFTLRAESIELEATVTNKGAVPAPAAFGYHPYFRISSPERKGVEVELPVTKRLVTTKDTVLLTGESEESDGHIKLRPGVYYDHVFGGITGRRMSLVDSNAGHVIDVDFDEKCELLLVYSPNDSEFVCIEPWSRGLGAFECLKEPGWEDGKSIPVHQPGEVRRYAATFSVR